MMSKVKRENTFFLDNLYDKIDYKEKNGRAVLWMEIQEENNC